MQWLFIYIKYLELRNCDINNIYFKTLNINNIYINLIEQGICFLHMYTWPDIHIH